MCNNNINNFEMEEKLERKLSKLYFGLHCSKITDVNIKGIGDYVQEYDEIDENGKLIIAKNLNLKLIEEHYEINVEMINNKEGVCPHCGQIVTKVHDYRKRLIQDVSVNGMPSYFVYKYKRFECKDCKKNFPEVNDDFPPKVKHSFRLWAHILESLKENVSRKTTERENHVSASFVKKILDSCTFKEKTLGEAICIDEFKGNMGYWDSNNKEWVIRKYQTLILNPANGEVINILPSRDQSLLVSYFSSIPEEQRNKVKYFICDMNACFMNVASKYFKNSKIVIDRFHYTKVVVEAFESVRINAQTNMSDDERKKFKNSKFVLLKHNEDMLDFKLEDDIYTLSEMLKIAPSLVKPYLLLQEFYDINKCKTRSQARIKLQSFYKHVEEYGGKAFMNAVKTLKRHETKILNSFECEYTNAYAEGTNNFIKVMKRVAYGLHDLERFKKRLELILNKYRRNKDYKHRLAEIKTDILKDRKNKRKNYENNKAATEIAA